MGWGGGGQTSLCDLLTPTGLEVRFMQQHCGRLCAALCTHVEGQEGEGVPRLGAAAALALARPAGSGDAACV